MRGRILHRTFQAAGEGFLRFCKTPVGLPPPGPGGGGAWPMVPPHGSAYGLLTGAPIEGCRGYVLGGKWGNTGGGTEDSGGFQREDGVTLSK
uniref:Uncharacterized protein n=1 Tax=Chromera velia CCMP2878 TaxID=1169474 RepID=A0A0G4FB93_9ALVE|eukprot:Cvel_16142.t1-p1 / transcript=Cvel_16142.t1 / gene=Cvel_16142 / organism=Chromera_velia_CCMP2878 / gene_product=hypothetical protein / transcript_product=hypothetical protein / location=Cvel_scaffold1229:27137-27409(+) / protein_length=91 / sequence_SO=supercontig / SO=protein_coding / is_pseudo=false